MVREGLFCSVVAGSADFGISCVEVMFNYAAEVGLYESIVFTKFFKLMAFLSNVDAVLVLDIQAGDVIWVCFEDVSCWGVLEFIALLLEVLFMGESRDLGIE